MAETKYFITVEWCNDGHRGIFCEPTGRGYSKETPHTEEEMFETLGLFAAILAPKSEPFTGVTVKKFKRFRPLGEYSGQYGIGLTASS